MCMAVGGLAGGVRSALDGKGLWTALSILGAGILGVVVVVSYFVNLEDR
ncbi:hypothetical protein ACFH04_13840 [Streptomyces noboritoensis]|uniref:Uncharacterized protein n=1 Tax=Streptomyces noboritoensis TaxID=67337 RepID=A0ABV6TG86_9ACTN